MSSRGDVRIFGEKVKKFAKGKGYESIPRELLQTDDLSLEAIGLICNLQSYPDTWELHKTELLNRFKYNKKSSVSRIWDELVEKGYIIQFRRRVEKRYEFVYYFSVTKFSLDDIVKMIADLKKENFIFYRKELAKKVDMTTENIIKLLPLTDDEKQQIKNMEISFWESENQNPKKEDRINVSSDSDFQYPKVDSPKPVTNKLTNNKLTKKESEEEEYISARENSQKMEDYISMNPKLKPVAKYLFGSNVSLSDIVVILEQLMFDDSLLDPDAIISQMKWCQSKSDIGDGIFDFPKYFVTGLRIKTKNASVSSSGLTEDELNRELCGDLPEIPMFNWTKR